MEKKKGADNISPLSCLLGVIVAAAPGLLFGISVINGWDMLATILLWLMSAFVVMLLLVLLSLNFAACKTFFTAVFYIIGLSVIFDFFIGREK